jgi:hypothetical protein
VSASFFEGNVDASLKPELVNLISDVAGVLVGGLWSNARAVAAVTLTAEANGLPGPPIDRRELLGKHRRYRVVVGSDDQLLRACEPDIRPEGANEAGPVRCIKRRDRVIQDKDTLTVGWLQ